MDSPSCRLDAPLFWVLSTSFIPLDPLAWEIRMESPPIHLLSFLLKHRVSWRQHLAFPKNVISVFSIYSLVTASFDVSLTRVLLARLHLPYQVHLRGRKTCYEDPILSYFWKLKPFHEKRVSTITIDRMMCELRRRSMIQHDCRYT